MDWSLHKYFIIIIVIIIINIVIIIINYPTNIHETDFEIERRLAGLS